MNGSSFDGGGCARMECDELDEPLFELELERDPASVQLHHGRLEEAVATCMSDIYKLPLSVADSDHKMKLVAIEYRARLVLERFRRLAVN